MVWVIRIIMDLIIFFCSFGIGFLIAGIVSALLDTKDELEK